MNTPEQNTSDFTHIERITWAIYWLNVHRDKFASGKIDAETYARYTRGWAKLIDKEAKAVKMEAKGE